MKLWKQLGMFSSQITVRCYHRSAGRCLSLLQESHSELSLSCLTSSHTTNNATLHTWLIVLYLKHLAHFRIFLVAAWRKTPYFSLAAWTFWSSVLSSICVRFRDVCGRSPGVPYFPPRQVDFTSSAVCGMQGSWKYHTVGQLFVACVELEPHFSLGS